MACGGLWWFVGVCGGLWGFVGVCGGFGRFLAAPFDDFMIPFYSDTATPDDTRHKQLHFTPHDVISELLINAKYLFYNVNIIMPKIKFICF